MKKNSTLKKLMVPLWAILITFLAAPVVHAQSTQKVSGRVLSANNQPITGATIKVKGTVAGTITDVQGNFALMAKKGDVLVISSISYQSKEVIVTDNPIVGNILLQDNSGLTGSSGSFSRLWN